MKRTHIVLCPHCGKEVLDHFTECPHCHGELKSKYYTGGKISDKTKKIITVVATVVTVAVFVVLASLGLLK